MARHLQRVHLLDSAPIVGRYYLVPTVHAWWCGTVATWPVHLPYHEDREHLCFDLHHFHVDARFIGRLPKHWQRHAVLRDAEMLCARAPVHVAQDWPFERHVTLRRRRCRRSILRHPSQEALSRSSFRCFYETFDGTSWIETKFGPRCPHKPVLLRQFGECEGYITCPLHGLRFDTTTGRCDMSHVLCPRQRDLL